MEVYDGPTVEFAGHVLPIGRAGITSQAGRDTAQMIFKAPYFTRIGEMIPALTGRTKALDQIAASRLRALLDTVAGEGEPLALPEDENLPDDVVVTVQDLGPVESVAYGVYRGARMVLGRAAYAAEEYGAAAGATWLNGKVHMFLAIVARRGSYGPVVARRRLRDGKPRRNPL